MWDVVNFSANVSMLNSVEQFYMGLSGGLNGTYKIVPFYEKLREYTFIESRSLWIFPIGLDSVEKKSFLENLYSLMSKEFKYRFHDQNCASQIEDLLLSSFRDGQPAERASTSPYNVLSNLEHKLSDPLYIASTEKTIENSLHNLGGVKIDSLMSNNRNNAESAILLSILEWKYFRRNILLNPTEKRHLENIRVSVSKNVHSDNTIELNRSANKFYMHSSANIGAGLRYSENKKPEYQFLYRFGLHEFQDNRDVFPNNDFIGLAKINIGFKNEKAFLNELWLFNQLSIPPKTPLSDYFSWRLAFGSVKNHAFKKPLHTTGIFLGFGKTYNMVRNISNLSFMVNLEPVYLSNFGYTVLAAPEIISNISFNNSLKWIAFCGTTSNLFKNSNLNYYFKNYLSIEMGIKNQLIFNYIFTQYNQSFNLQITRNF